MFVYNPPAEPFLEFVYRDDHIAVMNKQHGLLSVPGKALEHKDSLHYRITRTLPNASVVHRLDMATSGLIVFALHKEAHRDISKQFENREVKKTYSALVSGAISLPHGSLNFPLRCDWPNRPKQMVDYEKGKKALTHYKVLKNHPVNQKYINQSENGSQPCFTTVELSPVTGRSHQLRVHLKEIGHPILGDRLYADEVALHMASRLCLHATQLSFLHPNTRQHVSFTSPLNLEQFLV